MQYNKIALSLDDLANLLQGRGLVFDDCERVKRYLANIGYYRLSAYLLPFEKPVADGEKRNHDFLPNTTFEEVLQIYIFDRSLRLLVMEAIERIEISLRANWAQNMAEIGGPHIYMEPNRFKCPWEHAKSIAFIGSQLQQSSEKFIAHYRSKYKDPYLPPIWAIVETFSLGGLSRWIAATKDTEPKKAIARSIGIPTADLMESVLHALTPVRNICAHHCRLWNRRFTIQVPYIKRLKNSLVIEQNGDQNQPSRLLYNYIVILTHIMNNINPGSSWKSRLRNHVLTATLPQQLSMGFPNNWHTQAIFQ